MQLSNVSRIIVEEKIRVCFTCKVSNEVVPFCKNRNECKDCRKKLNKAYKSNPLYKIKRKEMDLKNIDKVRKSGRLSREKHKLSRYKDTKKWKRENKEYTSSYNKKYRKENKEKMNNFYMQRYIKKKKGSIGFGFEKEINAIYLECAKLSSDENIKYNVDHIVPITNSNVCGLHVPWNLQILSKVHNSTKYNDFDGTYENESWRSKLCN